jgi:hypothetical protein
VASRTSASLTLFENRSTPGRLELVAQPLPLAGPVEALTLGDVDGDGRLDIVATGQWPNGGVTVWVHTGAGAFDRYKFPTTRDPRQICLADLSGDGRPDLVTVNNDAGSISVYRNRSEPGTPAFDERHDFAIPGLLPNDPICVAAGDLDGDGRTDLAVGHYYSGFVTLLHNRSTR